LLEHLFNQLKIGLDISGLPFVINMTLPDEPENYIHRIGRVGRAERMGLAISIVARSSRERVWYHKCGKRGGIGCQKRNLVEDGGCTIWYDEPSLYSSILERLGDDHPILPLGSDFSLPPELVQSSNNEQKEENTSNSSFIVSNSQQYGLNQAEVIRNAEFSSHALILDESVKELAQLEFKAQNEFFLLQNMKF